MRWKIPEHLRSLRCLFLGLSRASRRGRSVFAPIAAFARRKEANLDFCLRGFAKVASVLLRIVCGDWFSIDMMEKKPLLSILLENQAARGESIFNTIKFAVLPIAKVFTMCFMGFLMASKYVNILPANGRKILNGLVFSLLLPCLIFSQLGRAITFQKLLEWWYIPVNVVVGSISGSLIGLIVAAIIRPPYPYFKFTVVHIGIGNIGNIPLVLIAALCRDESNPFGDPDKCSESGNAYISFGQWQCLT